MIVPLAPPQLVLSVWASTGVSGAGLTVTLTELELEQPVVGSVTVSVYWPPMSAVAFGIAGFCPG